MYKRKAEGGKRGGLANLDIVMFFTTVFTTADWLTLTLSCLHANARALALCSDNIRKDAGYKRDHVTDALMQQSIEEFKSRLQLSCIGTGISRLRVSALATRKREIE